MDSAALADVVLGGRYRLHSLLGSGGMALVYDGWDERLARPVAVKVLRPEVAAFTDVGRRFEAEARAAARLTHPNVVAVYDAGEDNGRAYIVMERLRGETLADSIARGPVDLAWLDRLAGDVLAALGAAHQAGIIHRDIKPSNILLGPDGRAKVGDFGIALDLGIVPAEGASEAARALTGAGLVVGTTAYLAPERVMGHAATPQSDLYSLGVVLYEAVTASKPFAGATPVAVAAAALRRAAPNPLSLRPDANPQLVAVIGRAMAVDPADRYASAAEMAADLRLPGRSATATATAVMVGIPGPAPAGPAEDAPRKKTTRPIRRRWEAMALGSLIVVAVVVAVVAGVTGALRATRSGSGSDARHQAALGTTTGTTATPGPGTPSATTVPSAPAPAPAILGTNQLDPVAAALQQIATRLARSNSPAAGQLASGLVKVANISDPASRAAAASSLLDQTVQWYQQGLLTSSEYAEAAALLGDAGAPNAPPPTAIAPSVKHRNGGPGGRGN